MVNFTPKKCARLRPAGPLSLLRLGQCYGIGLLGLCSMNAYADDTAGPKPFEWCLAEKVTHDSNLYRLPDGADVASRLGSEASRDDYLYSTSLCANGNWQPGRQDIKLKASVSDNRYQYNDVLNNVATNADLSWNWQTLGDWSGKIAGAYGRNLGEFYNDRPVTKDMVKTFQYSAELRHPIVGNLNAAVGGVGRIAQHDASDRKADDYRNNGGKASLEYVSRAANVVALDYLFSQARYSTEVFVNALPLARDYDEQVTSLRLKYAPANVTTIDATAGYLKRRYTEDSSRDYSGGVGRLSVQWQPLPALQFIASGWRELTSYFDAESDYFISRGVSLTSAWQPRDNLKIAPSVWWERQQYLNNDLATSTAAVPVDQRNDKVLALGAQFTYAFMRYLELNAGYRYERHESNQSLIGYHDNVANVMLRAKF